MPLVWKEVCRPNTPITYIDEATRQPRAFVATPEVIRHWHDSGKEMLRAELSIPVPLEHQPHLRTPLTPAERAKRSAADLMGNTGWVKDYRIDKKGGFWTQLNVEDGQVYEKLPRTIKFVSPYVTPKVTDGNGREWNNVITHMALTSRPRITKQAPFGADVAAALSLSPSPLPGGGFSFSLAGSLRAGGDPAAAGPLFPAAFSVLAGAALAEGYDEDDAPPPEKKGGKEGKKPPEKKAPPEESDEERAHHEGEEEGGPAEDMNGVACRMLKAMFGVDLGECDEPNLAGRLVDALMNRLAEEKGNAMTQTPPPAQTPPAAAAPTPAPRQPTVENQPMFMSLSLDDINKITDPGQKLMAMGFYELRQQNEKLTRARFNEAQKERQRRVDAAARKMPKKAAEFLKQEHEKVKAAAGMGFSMGDDGGVTDSFEAMLALAESFPDLPALLSGNARPDEVPQPADANDVVVGSHGVVQTAERSKELSDNLLRAGGLIQ